MKLTATKGPTREQLTDQQWSAVCNCFDTIARIVSKYRSKPKPESGAEPQLRVLKRA